ALPQPALARRVSVAPARSSRQPYWPYCRSEGMPDGIFRWLGGSCERDRLLSTAANSWAGLNGFCKLETAPNLVAMCRKSGGWSDAKLNCCPEITMTG